MNPEQFQRVSDLFEAARQLPAAERTAYLDTECAGDGELREAVDDLLGHHDRSADFLDGPALPDDLAPRSEPPPESIGPYRITGTLGEGGMGTVYLAEQTKPLRREVAVKVIKLGMDTREVVARFAAERQALAMMDHPNIARVFDAGATDTGRPFFVMERVVGEPITAFCRRNRLSIDERLALFVVVCRAVHHAHQKGIIHRDLKPSNILVSDVEGAAVPKLIDFGIAKATGAGPDRTLQTSQQQVIGTPAYMSPEQARVDDRGLDTRTDVYSLGVLLYELMSGTTPFDVERLRSATFGEMQRIIVEEDPIRLSARATRADAAATALRTTASQLARALRGDLDWITTKALEKEPGRRYDSASALADDVERHLANEPVLAGAPTAGYRLRKFVRRNRVAVLATALVTIALVAGLAVAIYGLVRARDAEEGARRDAERARAAERAEREQRQQAQENEQKANHVLRLVRSVFASADPWGARGGDYTVRQLLDDVDRSIWPHLEAQPLVEAAMRSTIGIAYEGLGLFDDAEEHLERAWTLLDEHRGPDDPKTARARLDYAWLLQLRGRLTESLPHLEGARAALEAAHPDGHRDLVLARLDVATVQRRLGAFDASERAADEALELGERLLPSNDPDLARIRKLLAQLLDARGDSHEAVALVREAIAAYQAPATAPRESVPGDESSAVWVIRAPQSDNDMTAVLMHMSLARFLANTGDYDEAISLIRAAHAEMLRRFGERHVQTVQAASTLGSMLLRSGKSREAAAILEPLLEIAVEDLPEDAPERVDVELDLARLYVRRRDSRRALPLLESLLERTSRLPNGDAVIEPVRQLLGLALMADRRYRDAVPHLEFAFEANRARYGERHRSTLSVLTNLATARAALGEFDAATRTFEAVIAAETAPDGTLHSSALPVLNNLASLHLRRRNYTKAKPLLQQAYDAAVERFGDGSPNTFPPAVNLAECLQRTGATKEAERMLRKLLRHANEHLDPTHGTRLVILNNLGRALAAQKRFADAEPMLRELAAVRVKKFGIDHRSAQLAMMSHAELLRLLGRHEEGLRIATRANAAAERLDGPQRHRDHDALVLGSLHLELEAWAEAEALLRTALERFPKESVGNRALATGRLATALAARGRNEEAESLFTSCAETTILHGRAAAFVRDEIRKRIVAFYEARGDADAAERWRTAKTTKAKPADAPGR